MTIGIFSIRTRIVFAALASLAFGGAAAADEPACVGLRGKVFPAAMIALPTSGAMIKSAEWHSEQAAGSAFCQVLGQVKPVDPAAPMINVEVNLPADWNGKAIQYGGGGLNGSLITGLDSLRDAPPQTPSPLRQGYVTFGTDSGHQSAPGKDLQEFALNDEALTNHAYAAYKKTHDVALLVVGLYYRRHPSKMYFFGASEGGREALMSAQKYPQDYDGVVAIVPILSWMGSNLASYQQYQDLLHGGWMSAAKVKLVQSATLDACDARDGAKDGVIARYLGCDGLKAVESLRCPKGGDDGDACLSDDQIRLVKTVRSPHPYAVKLNNGERSYPPFPVGGETNAGAMVPTIIPRERPAADDTGRWNYAVGDMRYFVTRNATFSGPLDEVAYAARLQQVSALMDMNKADLRAFKKRGGKLIIKSNAADYLVSPQSEWRYYENIQKTMGKPSAESFVRLYVAPGVQHVGQGVSADGTALPDKVDLLPVLEAWVEKGKAPPDQLILTNFDKAGQPASAWPMCRYPFYPHFNGGGDPKSAGAYSCRSAR